MALRRAVLSAVCSMMISSLGGFDFFRVIRVTALEAFTRRAARRVCCARANGGDFLTRSKLFERCGHVRDNAAATGVPTSNDSFLLRGEKAGPKDFGGLPFRGPLEGLFSSQIAR